MALSIAQTKTGSNTVSATSLVITMDSTPGDGRTMIAVIGTPSSASAPVSSISQTGATWAQDVISKYTGPSYPAGGSVEIWRATNISGAAAAITINLASSLLAEGVIYEIADVASSPLDKTATATGDDGGI